MTAAGGQKAAELRSMMQEAREQATELGHDLGWWRPAGERGAGVTTSCHACGRDVMVTLAQQLERVTGSALAEPCPALAS